MKHRIAGLVALGAGEIGFEVADRLGLTDRFVPAGFLLAHLAPSTHSRRARQSFAVRASGSRVGLVADRTMLARVAGRAWRPAGLGVGGKGPECSWPYPAGAAGGYSSSTANIAAPRSTRSRCPGGLRMSVAARARRRRIGSRVVSSVAEAAG